MSKKEEELMAKQTPETRKVLDALIELFKEHNGCCWEMGTLYKRIQDKFKRAGPNGLRESDLEVEITSLKSESSKNSSICYRMGLRYNELRQLLGQEEAEALIEDHPRLSGVDLPQYGRVAERFSQPHTVAYGIEKMVELAEYAELNRMTFGEADPGASEISLLNEEGRWKKVAFRDCSADELGQTVIAIKAQRGIPVDNEFDDLELD